ncbi:MAG: CheR family methyltransferase [Nanoarchaeota archaeon]
MVNQENFISNVNIVDEDKWLILKETIKKELNFQVNNYRDNYLKRRVECRLRILNLNSYIDYVNLLVTDEAEKKKLNKELTIHVTHFFRDKSLYQEIQDWIIPQIIKEKQEKNLYKIRIWSAGCSVGAEPYSIAIILREVLGNSINKFEIKIDASDVDQETISKAILGIYDLQYFTETSPLIQSKYFQKINDDLYSVLPIVKSMVNFKIQDIFDESSIMKYDLIFCRNTVIYFDKQAKVDLYESIYSKLNKGGFLVLGKSEFLDNTARTKFIVYNNNERIYRKPF